MLLDTVKDKTISVYQLFQENNIRVHNILISGAQAMLGGKPRMRGWLLQVQAPYSPATLYQNRSKLIKRELEEVMHPC